jgi:hypothetical protein
MTLHTENATRVQLEQQKTSGANWFYWLAGLSLVNSFLMYIGNSLHIVLGLGITQVIDGLMVQTDGTLALLALFFDVCVAGMVAGIGYFAHQRQSGFVVGMSVYGLDSVLFFLASDWVGLLIHAFVLWCLWNGYVAAGKLAASADLGEGTTTDNGIPAETVALPAMKVA